MTRHDLIMFNCRSTLANYCPARKLGLDLRNPAGRANLVKGRFRTRNRMDLASASAYLGASVGLISQTLGRIHRLPAWQTALDVSARASSVTCHMPRVHLIQDISEDVWTSGSQLSYRMS